MLKTKYEDRKDLYDKRQFLFGSVWKVDDREVVIPQADKINNRYHPSENQDLLHEVRVLKNKAENLEHDFMYYFKLANKLDHQIKRYRERLELIKDKTSCVMAASHASKALEGAE